MESKGLLTERIIGGYEMRVSKIILTFSVLLLFIAGFNTYSQDDTYGISAGWASEETDGSEPMVMIEIQGSRIGDTVASAPVALPKEGVITYVDTEVGHGFTIVQVDENGVEHQVLALDSPEQAIGKRLPIGTYKVYPDKIDGSLKLGKITAIVHIDFIKNGEGELR